MKTLFSVCENMVKYRKAKAGELDGRKTEYSF